VGDTCVRQGPLDGATEQQTKACNPGEGKRRTERNPECDQAGKKPEGSGAGIVTGVRIRGERERLRVEKVLRIVLSLPLGSTTTLSPRAQ
jgi:hypothetical protein